ncbi:MAG TPA: GAF domain-containing protein [Terriglobales bacterium]|nr:GAF domain-containing protein [Terriglobales bacterium]
MADPKAVAEQVERVVNEIFDQRVGELRAEVVKRVLEEMAPLLVEEPPATAVLESSVASIEDGSTQADILRALLNGAAKFSGRVALFVVRGNTATGWESRGFEDEDAIKKVSLDAGQGLTARAMQERTPAAAAAAEFDPGFIESVGNPADGNALVVPLLVRDKVPAVVYADAGSQGGKLEHAAVQLLVRSAGHWLELVSARKAGPAAEKADAEPERVEKAEEAPAPPPPAVAPEIPAEHEEVHKKAKKFAKLLVDELKLYNQGKVAEGRTHKDLYERLKEDIDKSRAAYEKRYGNTPAASGDYFRQAIIRILADNDESVLGSSFPG